MDFVFEASTKKNPFFYIEICFWENNNNNDSNNSGYNNNYVRLLL